MGAKGCRVQLSQCGCWVPCRGQGQQEKHLLFRWPQGLKSRGSSQTVQDIHLPAVQSRAGAASPRAVCISFLCPKERQMALFPSPHCPGPKFPDSLFCCYLLFLVLFALSCSPACLLALTLSSTSPSWSTQESPSCGYTSHCFRLTPAETLQEAEMLGLVTKQSPTWCQQPIRVHLGRQVWVSGVRRFWGSKEGWAQWWL